MASFVQFRQWRNSQRRPLVLSWLETWEMSNRIVGQLFETKPLLTVLFFVVLAVWSRSIGVSSASAATLKEHGPSMGIFPLLSHPEDFKKVKRVLAVVSPPNPNNAVRSRQSYCIDKKDRGQEWSQSLNQDIEALHEAFLDIPGCTNWQCSQESFRVSALAPLPLRMLSHTLIITNHPSLGGCIQWCSSVRIKTFLGS